MLHPLKITSTLADETRFQIYEYMLQQKKHLLYKILQINLIYIQMWQDCI